MIGAGENARKEGARKQVARKSVGAKQVPCDTCAGRTGDACDKSLTEIEICEAHPRLRVRLVERDGLEERLARSLRPLVGERALRLVEREEQNFRI